MRVNVKAGSGDYSIQDVNTAVSRLFLIDLNSWRFDIVHATTWVSYVTHCVSVGRIFSLEINLKAMIFPQ